MRLFVGLRPSEEFRAALSALQDRLREAGVAAKYMDASNLHLTLAFIGEWAGKTDGILPEEVPPFPLVLSGIGLFPKAKVIWAGVEASGELDRLAERVRERLADAGIPFDPKPFVPHFTLGRKPAVPAGFDPPGIRVPPAAMTVSDVCLYKSERGESGPVYTVIGCSPGEGGASA